MSEAQARNRELQHHAVAQDSESCFCNMKIGVTMSHHGTMLMGFATVADASPITSMFLNLVGVYCHASILAPCNLSETETLSKHRASKHLETLHL